MKGTMGLCSAGAGYREVGAFFSLHEDVGDAKVEGCA